MSEPLVRLRELGRRAYRLLPGRPLHGLLVAADRFWRTRRAGRTVVVRRGGLTFELDLGQLIDSAIYHDGAFEPDTVRAYRGLVRPGMTVFDIGANVGAHTLRLAALVGPAGRVYAFEPSRWAAAKLERNLGLNPSLRNVQLERLALSDRDEGEAEVCLQAQWRVDGGPATWEHGRVDRLRLDTFCSEHAVGAVQMIKLDVDGYESKILRGAREVLRRHRPMLIVELGEYWQRRAGDDLEGLLELLASADYEYRDERHMRPIDDLSAHVPRGDSRETVNVVCLPRGAPLWLDENR